MRPDFETKDTEQIEKWDGGEGQNVCLSPRPYHAPYKRLHFPAGTSGHTDRRIIAGKRTLLTAAARSAHQEAGRDGETPISRTKKHHRRQGTLILQNLTHATTTDHEHHRLGHYPSRGEDETGQGCRVAEILLNKVRRNWVVARRIAPRLPEGQFAKRADVSCHTQEKVALKWPTAVLHLAPAVQRKAAAFALSPLCGSLHDRHT